MAHSDHGPGLLSSDGSRIVILERPGCHLCTTASAIVHRIADDVGTTVQHVNIDTSDELKKRWSIEIPVIAVDGEVVNVYRANETEIRAALSRSPKGMLARVRSFFTKS